MVARYDILRANILRSGDYSRANRFIMNFTVPPALSSATTVDYERLSLNCSTGLLPGRSFNVAETRYSGGYNNKKALDTTFTELECVFYLSEDMFEKQIFDAWQSFIFDPAYQISSYPEEYLTDITITKQTKGVDQNNFHNYTFIDAFPSNVQDIAQGYENNSVIDVLPVTFTYHRWYYSNRIT